MRTKRKNSSTHRRKTMGGGKKTIKAGGKVIYKTRKRGGAKRNRKTKKIKRKQKGGGTGIVEQIGNFSTKISFFMVLYYLHKSDDNAELVDTTIWNTYKNFINSEIRPDVKKFHKYEISSESGFSFKYNDTHTFYKLSVKGVFNMINNPKCIFPFNNYHAIVGYNENVKFTINNLTSYNHYLNSKDPPKNRLGTASRKNTAYVYPTLQLNDLTQNNIEKLESKSVDSLNDVGGGGTWREAKKIGRNIQKFGTNIAQDYRKSSLGHSTESSLISKGSEYLYLQSKELSYVIFESSSRNINSYELEPNKTIICPLDVLVGWDEGCHIGICRTRNWNGEKKLQASDLGNGFEGTQRDYELYNKT